MVILNKQEAGCLILPAVSSREGWEGTNLHGDPQRPGHESEQSPDSKLVRNLSQPSIPDT